LETAVAASRFKTGVIDDDGLLFVLRLTK
jgi:hypothetical protein